MGSSMSTGVFMTALGCDQALGFEKSAQMVINMHGIQPWPARDLLKDNLKRQAELAKRCPFRRVPVEEGLLYFNGQVGGWIHQLTRDKFVHTAIDLLMDKQVRHTTRDRDELFEVFDSMDFDKNGELSIGEWAAGLTVFFQGSQKACTEAVFKALDRDNSGTLTKLELQEYLTPFVKAMTPPEAAELRPLLLRKCCNDIYNEMDLDHAHDISSEEMVEWNRKGNSIVDKLANIIDHEVYTVWLSDQEKRKRREQTQTLYGQRQTV